MVFTFLKIFKKRKPNLSLIIFISIDRDSNINIAVGTQGCEHQEVGFVNTFSKHSKV